ncbi:MAG: hypothetical protein FJX75_06095 [Armatimonadetes bacterium]|nr:hypothetical protein [Armatimonadota bacterium]
MRCYVVVENFSYGCLLQRLLADETTRDGVHIIPTDGKSHAASLASSWLAVHPEPVVLVLNAETTDEESKSEQRVTYREGLAVAGGNGRSQLVLATPHLAACFFQRPAIDEPSVISQLARLGREPTPEQLVEARYVPREVLRRISDEANVAMGAMLSRLAADRASVDRLRQTPVIQDILRAIADLTKQQAA